MCKFIDCINLVEEELLLDVVDCLDEEDKVDVLDVELKFINGIFLQFLTNFDVITKFEFLIFSYFNLVEELLLKVEVEEELLLKVEEELLVVLLDCVVETCVVVTGVTLVVVKIPVLVEVIVLVCGVDVWVVLDIVLVPTVLLGVVAN